MSQGRATWRWVGTWFLTLLLLCGWGATAGWSMAIQLRSDPDRLPADGRSQAVIVAEVTGSNGVPVPDGTTVQFLTTLGRIVSPVQTLGGLAQTSLTSSREAGTAIVSAVAAGSRGILNVEFTALPGAGRATVRLIELTADDLAYGGDLCLFVATDNAKLQMGGISLQADGFQYEVSNDVVRAQGRVVLKSGDKEVHADAMRYDLMTLQGRLIRLTGNGGGEREVVEGERLEERPDKAKDQALWTPLKTGDTHAWIRCAHALVDPGKRIIFDHATFYVNDAKIFSLRRHVMTTEPTSALLGQVLGFTTTGGVSLDYPYYFDAGADSLGALHLRRNTAVGTQFSPGWMLGLSEEYTGNFKGKMSGEFSLDDILNPSRGVHWQQQSQFAGGLSASADFDSMSFSSEQPSYRTSGLNVSRPAGGGTVTMSLGMSSYNGSSDKSESLGYRFNSFNLGSGISATPSWSVEEYDREAVAQGLLVDPRTGEPIVFNNTSGRGTSTGLDLGIGFGERKIAGMRLTGSITTGYSWDLASLAGASQFSTQWTLDRKFGKDGYAGLTFQYSMVPPTLQTGLLNETNQEALTLTARSKIKEGNVGLRITESLDGQRRYGSFNFSEPLPFGKDMLGQPIWTITGYHMFSLFDTYQAHASVLSLSRAISKYQLSLNYSPEGGGNYGSSHYLSPWGFGYTYSGGKHLWLELSGATM